MNDFIELIKIPELEQAEDYTILLEQSFSQFGDADLIVIAHYAKPENNKVLFIEGKVKTFQKKSWSLKKQFERYNKKDKENNLEKYNGYSSNLFFQLYLKKLLIDNWDDINEKGTAYESKFKEDRKIGNNDIVKDAFQKLKSSEAFYIGLIPSTEKEIKKFKKGNESGIHFLAWEIVHKFCEDNSELEDVLGIFKYNKGQIYKTVNCLD